MEMIWWVVTRLETQARNPMPLWELTHDRSEPFCRRSSPVFGNRNRVSALVFPTARTSNTLQHISTSQSVRIHTTQ